MKYSKKWSIFNKSVLFSLDYDSMEPDETERIKNILTFIYSNINEIPIYKVNYKFIDNATDFANSFHSFKKSNEKWGIAWQHITKNMNQLDAFILLYPKGEWHFMVLDTKLGKGHNISGNNRGVYEFSQDSMEDYRNFMVYAFIKSSNIETKVIKSRPKSKSFHCRHERQNDTGLDIHQCDLNWYTKSLQNHPFVVRGHWRMQACGQGMKDRKLKWIDTFMKGGYLKGAYKEKV